MPDLSSLLAPLITDFASYLAIVCAAMVVVAAAPFAARMAISVASSLFRQLSKIL